MPIFWAKHVGMIGGTTILQEFAWMMLLRPHRPWPKSKKWPKLTWRPKICRILILMKMAPENQKNSKNSMVVFLEFGFLFPMSYKQFKI